MSGHNMVKENDFQQLIPDARQSTIDPRAERIYYTGFIRVYSYINGKINEIRNILEGNAKKIEEQSKRLEEQTSLVKSFGTQLIGVQNQTNPLATLGEGTVMSVSAIPTSIFDVTDSTVNPIISLDAQAKNKVLAGPTTGANAEPTFRLLVSADLTGLSTDAEALAMLAL